VADLDVFSALALTQREGAEHGACLTSAPFASGLTHLGGQVGAEGVAQAAGGAGQSKVLRRLERREAEPVGEPEALEVGEGQQHEAVEQAGVPERAAVPDGCPDAMHHLTMTAQASSFIVVAGK